jgi:hypothetical protein
VTEAGAMMYIPGVIKIGSGFQILTERGRGSLQTYRHTQADRKVIS